MTVNFEQIRSFLSSQPRQQFTASAAHGDADVTLKLWVGGKVARVYVSRNEKGVGYYDADGDFIKQGAQWSPSFAQDVAEAGVAAIMAVIAPPPAPEPTPAPAAEVVAPAPARNIPGVPVIPTDAQPLTPAEQVQVDGLLAEAQALGLSLGYEWGAAHDGTATGVQRHVVIVGSVRYKRIEWGNLHTIFMPTAASAIREMAGAVQQARKEIEGLKAEDAFWDAYLRR